MYAIMVETHIPMFEGALITMTELQKNLLYWCKFYNQYVFSQEKTNRPDDFTVDYDILMDDWVEKKHFLETSNVTSANSMNEVIDFQ